MVRALIDALRCEADHLVIDATLEAPSAPAALVLRRRSGRGPEITRPVTTAGAHLTAVLAAADDGAGAGALEPGLWDLFVRDAAGAEHRATDPRGPVVSATYVWDAVLANGLHLQPLTTGKGAISVLVRRADRHVEVAEVWVSDDVITIVGTHPSPVAAGEPAVWAAGAELPADVTVTGQRISVAVRATGLAVWLAAVGVPVTADLSLRLPDDAGDRPLAGWLDDIRAKHEVMRYPSVTLSGGQHATVEPMWSADNVLRLVAQTTSEASAAAVQS